MIRTIDRILKHRISPPLAETRGGSLVSFGGETICPWDLFITLILISDVNAISCYDELASWERRNEWTCIYVLDLPSGRHGRP